MKLTKSKLKEMIREELNEAYVDPDDASRLMDQALEDLESALKKMKPTKAEKWTEKYHRSVPGVLDLIEKVTKFLDRLK